MQSGINSPARRPRSLFRDRRGVVAIMLGLLALPLIGIVGLAVDYGFATRAQALLNSAADSAAIAATDAASNAFVNNPNNLTDFSLAAIAAGKRVFNAQTTNIPSVTVTPITVTLTQPPQSAIFISVVTYRATYKTWFGVLFKVANFPLGGSSTAKITMKAYEDFHILMDFSGSMAIAATAAGMSTLAARTLAASNNAYQGISPYNGTYNGKNSFLGQGSHNCATTIAGVTTYNCGAAQSTTQGCAFGCHWDTSNTNCTNCDFYEIARANNVQLRQDLEQQAVQTVISTMSTQDTLNQYRAAVYAFYTKFTTTGSTTTVTNNMSPVSLLPAIGATASDLATAAAAAAAVQMPISGTDDSNAPAGAPKYPEPNTNFGAAMTALAAGMNCPGVSGTYIPCPGDGGTASTAQEFLFIITDGIEDFCTSISGTSGCSGRTIRTIQPSECAALKAQGVQIMVLYVQYVPLDKSPYSNPFYISSVQSFVDPNGTAPPTSPPYPAGTVPANLMACSSIAGQLFYASDSTQITTQLNAMLLAAQKQGVRLVQ